MKHGLFLTLLLSSLLVQVSPVQADQGDSVNPADFCHNSTCSAPMIAISKSYEEGFSGFASGNLSAYSGKCFHLNSMYDPTYAHMGAFVFSNGATTPVIQGIFGFFYESDPFAGMSPEEVQSALEKSGSAGAPGVVRPDHLELVYKNPNSELRYWFRSDKSAKTLFVIGRQTDGSNGIQSLVFCKMLRH